MLERLKSPVHDRGPTIALTAKINTDQRNIGYILCHPEGNRINIELLLRKVVIVTSVKQGWANERRLENRNKP